jgi:tetratricopeptide (TPR) repeat protein
MHTNPNARGLRLQDAPARLRNLSGPNLDRLIKILAIVLVIGVPLVIGFYWLDRHPDAGPSLNDRAVVAAEDAVRADPNNLAARNHLAAAYVSAGRYDEGIAAFTEVLKAAASDRAALLGRGLAYLQTKQLDAAAADFSALVEQAKGAEFAATDPQLEQAYYELGVIALEQSRPADAVEHLRSALRINGSDADALYTFGLALIRSGDPAKGVEALRRAVAFVPSGWCEPYQGLVEGYTATGSSEGTAYAGAMVAFCNGQLDQAEAGLASLTSGPMAVDAHLGLALVAVFRGDTATAEREYQSVLATDPDNASARIGLSQLASPHRSSAPTLPPSSAAPETQGS